MLVELKKNTNNCPFLIMAHSTFIFRFVFIYNNYQTIYKHIKNYI